jgi:hypothetical protein
MSLAASSLSLYKDYVETDDRTRIQYCCRRVVAGACTISTVHRIFFKSGNSKAGGNNAQLMRNAARENIEYERPWLGNGSLL